MDQLMPPFDSSFLDPVGASATPAAPVIAFFDVDNTLLRGASVYHVAIGAWKLGIVSVRDIMRAFWQQRHFIKVGENQTHLSAIKERALQVISGRSEAELRTLSEDIFDRRIRPRLWPETVALTQEHLALGHQVWIISATAQSVATVFAERLGLTGALGTVFEARDGVFTGKLLGSVLHGQEKADAAVALAGRLAADSSACWAYSDSSNDIPLLSFVGNPVVVNPDKTLLAHAQTEKWAVMLMKPSSIRDARRRVKRRAA
jgi:HAD superfamily hydrolase (TIGR01490 family)